MTSKLLIASTVALLSLATTAFAGEGGSDPIPSGNYVVGFDNSTLPENGQNGPVMSANSVPPGFYSNTVQQLRADNANRYFAEQAARIHYAQGRQAAPRG